MTLCPLLLPLTSFYYPPPPLPPHTLLPHPPHLFPLPLLSFTHLLPCFTTPFYLLVPLAVSSPLHFLPSPSPFSLSLAPSCTSYHILLSPTWFYCPPPLTPPTLSTGLYPLLSPFLPLTNFYLSSLPSSVFPYIFLPSPTTLYTYLPSSTQLPLLRPLILFPLRVRYGADGAPQNVGPWPFCPPRPTQRPGAGVFFGIPCPSPGSGPCPTHTPDGSPLKIGGNKRGPVQGMTAGGPRTGAGRGLPEKYPPGHV